MTPHFTRAELSCKCCGEMRLSEAFVNKLEALRVDAGFPFHISSGYRCPKHNQAVSSTGARGPHTRDAVDVRIYGERAHRLVGLATKHGFSGIGVSQKGPQGSRFIHLDDLPNGPDSPRPWIWSY